MFRMPDSFDSWKLDTPPRYEDHPGVDPEPDEQDDDDTDEWIDEEDK